MIPKSCYFHPYFEKYEHNRMQREEARLHKCSQNTSNRTFAVHVLKALPSTYSITVKDEIQYIFQNVEG